MNRTIKNNLLAGGALILLAFVLNLAQLSAQDFNLVPENPGTGTPFPCHCQQQLPGRSGFKAGSPLLPFGQNRSGAF